MKNRYADELALKARVELEAEKNKAIEMEKESARKLEEARQRLEKTRIENERKEDMLMRTDEAVSRADELQHQAREMMQKEELKKGVGKQLRRGHRAGSHRTMTPKVGPMSGK